MARARRQAATAIMAAGLLVAAGCGDDSDDGDDATAAGSADEEASATSDAADEEEADGDAAEHTEAQRRLLVTDAASPQAAVLDFATGETIETLELEAVAGLGVASTEDGRYALIPHDESVSIVDSGVWSEPHGDHAHYYSAPPAVIGAVDGDAPSHLVSHDDQTALYFDGTGEAVVLDEKELDDGAVEPVATVETEMPHHGFAVPFHGQYLTTVQDSETETGMPDAVGVRAVEGELAAEFECVDTHGEGALGDAGLAACADGVLVVTEDGDEWAGEILGYPDVDDEDPWGFGDARAWALMTADGVDRAAAPLGARHVLWFDPINGDVEAFDVAAEGTAVANFGIGIAADGGTLAVLTTDGVVRLVDVNDGSIVQETDVIEPFEEDERTERWARLALVEDRVLVSDPFNGEIVELSLEDLAVTDTFEPGFDPGAFLVLG